VNGLFGVGDADRGRDRDGDGRAALDVDTFAVAGRDDGGRDEGAAAVVVGAGVSDGVGTAPRAGLIIRGGPRSRFRWADHSASAEMSRAARTPARRMRGRSAQ
jgi:hypothetical protein